MIGFTYLQLTKNDQLAEYSLVGSLVGLVARFLFQPAEEAAFNTFSNNDSSKDLTQNNWALLRKWLGAMLAIGFSAITFSYTCGMQFLKVVYSDKWATVSAE